MSDKPKVTITKDGPYIVTGNIPLAIEVSICREGDPIEWKGGKEFPRKDSYALCRCGESANKPFCDGTHTKIKFDGKETANREPYLIKAKLISGPEIELTDLEELCSEARFCHQATGTWNNVRRSDNSKSKEIAIKSACNCPSGRLVVWDKKTKKEIEPEFDPSISIVEDPEEGVSGGLWLKGGIELQSSDGSMYESRNRMCLCRCGKSNKKPFCDGTHIEAKFKDGDESLK